MLNNCLLSKEGKNEGTNKYLYKAEKQRCHKIFKESHSLDKKMHAMLGTSDFILKECGRYYVSLREKQHSYLFKMLLKFHIVVWMGDLGCQWGSNLDPCFTLWIRVTEEICMNDLWSRTVRI